MRRLALATALVVSACGDDIPTIELDGSTGAPAPGSSTGPGEPPDDGVIDSSGTPPEPEILVDVTLDLEIRESLELQITTTAGLVEARIVASRGYGVAPEGQLLVGRARIDDFPEAGAILYTARLSAPPQPDGPCGDAPVSLALSLHADGDSTFVAGGLTPYCGADTWYGVPPIEPLRLSGHIGGD